MSILTAFAAVLAQAGDEQRDWAAALRIDATAMHEAIATSHPGPVNPEDPGFAAHNDAQLARALDRARRANSFAHYFYAMQEYASSFDDGHLSYGVWGATPDSDPRWPGFLTRYDANGHKRVFVSIPWSGVPLGARLQSCDGREADQVARDRVGSRFGRWTLAAQRQAFGAMTFLDTGNPYVAEVRRCRFQHADRRIDVTLKWRASDEDVYGRYVFAAPRRAEVGQRRLADGTHWFTLPSFNGNPDSPTGKQLRALLSYLDENAGAVRAAPAIVLDLRGNGGGSSDWSHQIASRLWGPDLIASRPDAPMTISWRASADNVAAIRALFGERSKGGNLPPEVVDWFTNTIAGLEKAVAAGDPLWIIKPEPRRAKERSRKRPIRRMRGPVYVLTDLNCMSACLDAVDLWTRLGAIPIGQETGADTLYMETRQVRLPSGLGGFSLPMKVYSGRARGKNAPVRPRHPFHGDLADTAALEHWILTLPERKSTVD